MKITRMSVAFIGIMIPGFASAEPPVVNPTVAVTVDTQAYDTAYTLAECMRSFKASHREERRDPEVRKKLDENERIECRLEESQKSISGRLRVANPQMSEDELAQEYQKTVVLATLDAFKKSLEAKKADNASNK